MKIILISPLPPPAGGMETWTEKYMESSQTKKNEVRLINIGLIGNRIVNLNKRNLFDEIKRSFNIIKELNESIKEKTEIVHLNTACGSFGIFRDYLCAVLVKSRNIKLLTQYHCNIEDMVKTKLGTFILKKMIKLSDKNLVLNNSSKKYIEKISNKKGIILPNFIANDIFKKLSEDKIFNEKIKRIIYTGHVMDTKGSNEILEVAKVFPNTEFILAGNINKKYLEKEKSENVRFLGELSQDILFSEIKKSDLYLFPSYTEGFPMAVLEAMSAGLPIIATPVGAIPEMIGQDGGILTKVGSIEEICNAINELENVFIRKKMSEANINKVKKEYLEESVLNRLFEVYEGKVEGDNL